MGVVRYGTQPPRPPGSLVGTESSSLDRRDRQWPSHPRYGIACRIEEISGDEILLNQGVIYASPVRLRQHGWISAEWGYLTTIAKRSPNSITKVANNLARKPSIGKGCSAL